MLKVNKKIEYALMILKHMSLQGSTVQVNAKQMVEKFNAPFDVVSKVMQTLAHHGVLTSSQGAHGGYSLKSDLTAVNFHDLNEMLLGNFQFANCITDAQSCEMAASCNIISPITQMNRRIVELFRTVSVAELIAETRSAEVVRN